MFKVQVVQHHDLRNVCPERTHHVWRNENIRANLFEQTRHAIVVPNPKQNRMPGLRTDHMRNNVIGKNKVRIERSVEEKMKFVFRMITANSTEVLEDEPTDAVHSAFQQESGVDGNLHFVEFNSGAKNKAAREFPGGSISEFDPILLQAHNSFVASFVRSGQFFSSFGTT